jgi:hypothetical protein
MPKIGPNKVSIDPKAYAARVTRAKKKVATMDPATKPKLSEYYPKVTREESVKQALTTKRAAARPVVRASVRPTVKPKAPVKKKVLVMPDQISPSKMTPAQKARYLKNPERYNR